MKKILSILLILAMILSASICIFAEEEMNIDYDGGDIIVIAKDDDGKTVSQNGDGQIYAAYLSEGDFVVQALQAAGSAENFVSGLGLKTDVDNLITNYSVSGELFKFSETPYISPTYPVEMTFKVDGVKATDTVVILVQDASGTWNVVEATASNGTVTANFESFGKVVVLVGDEPNGKDPIWPIIPPSPSPSKPVEPVVPSRLFIDISTSDWYYDAVMYCADKGYMNGVAADKFGPNIITTRGMVAVMIYRLEGSPEFKTPAPFIDLSQNWYKEGIAWAYANGIVTGYTEEYFGPEDPITREQLAAMLYRYTKFKGGDLTQGSLDGFKDAAEVSRYAVEPVKWAVYNKYINGRLNNGVKLLAPTALCSRAELAQVFYNYTK